MYTVTGGFSCIMKSLLFIDTIILDRLGTYSSTSGSIDCDICSKGTYSEENENNSCKVCNTFILLFGGFNKIFCETCFRDSSCIQQTRTCDRNFEGSWNQNNRPRCSYAHIRSFLCPIMLNRLNMLKTSISLLIAELVYTISSRLNRK